MRAERRQFKLARTYAYTMFSADGSSVERSDEAFKWFARAAEQGHTEAQHQLGVLYMLGRGVVRDDKEAVNWWRRSAEKGH
jgi:TPR repeat protein